jgi:hypothetical protein
MSREFEGKTPVCPGEEEEKKKKLKKKKPKSSKFLVAVVAIIIGLAVLVLLGKAYLETRFGSGLVEGIGDFVDDTIVGSEGKVTTITESTIEDVFEISELQTADYIYNAITEVYDKDGKTLKYYVAYEGTVTAGIDFERVKTEVDNEAKTIRITVPDVSIQDTLVNPGTMEYIFTKEKYDDESVFQEAYSICQEDLKTRAYGEDELLQMAKENAKQVIEALVSPWVGQIDSEYTITVL